MPQNASLAVDSSSLTVMWTPPNNQDQYDLLNYTVMVTSSRGLNETGNVTNTILQFSVNETLGVTFVGTIAAINTCEVTGEPVQQNFTVSRKSPCCIIYSVYFTCNYNKWQPHSW